MQVDIPFPVRRLVSQPGNAFEPELAGCRDLVAFLREYDGKEACREIGIANDLRRHSQQQARLPLPRGPITI